MAHELIPHVPSPRNLRLPRIPRDAWAAVVAVLAGFSWAFGLWAEGVFTAEKQTTELAVPTWVALAGIGISVAAYVVVSLIFRSIDRARDAEGFTLGRSPALDRELRVRVAKIAGVLVLAWLPYLVLRFPGNLDADTVWQLMETCGLAKATDHHPWFDTLVFTLFWSAGGALGSHMWSLLLYSLAQMALTSFALAISLVYLRVRMGASRRYVLGALIFLAIFPFVPLAMTTMAKDSLFASSFVLYLLGYVEMVRTRGEALRSPRFVVAFVGCTMLLMLTKKTGVVLAAASLAVLLPWCRGNRVKLAATMLTTVAAFALGWSVIALGLMGVSAGEEEEIYSVPAQQIARVLLVHGDELTDEEYATLAKVWTKVDTMAKDYVPTRADSAKDHWYQSAPVAEKLEFLSLYVRLGLRWPQTYALALAGTTYQLISPVVEWPFVKTVDEYYAIESSLYYIDEVTYTVSGYAPLAADGYKTTTATQVEELMQGAVHPGWAAVTSGGLYAVYSWLVGVFPFPFSKAPYAFWVPLLVLGFACRRHEGMTAMALWPAVLNIASIVVGPVALPRYMVSVVITAPFVLGLVFLRDHTAEDAHTHAGKFAAEGPATEGSAAGTAMSAASKSPVA